MNVIKVNNQIASKYNNELIVSDAVNFPQISFEFDSSWNGLNKTYQFSNGIVHIDVETNDTLVYIPNEALRPGTLYVKVYGRVLNTEGTVITRRATINPISYTIIDSKLTEATNASEVTPDKYDQIRTMTETAVADAAAAKAKAAESGPNALAAAQSAVQSLSSAQTATAQANRASSEADRASNKAEEAKSYAVGGTGTRPGEDEDNSKHYSGISLQAMTDFLAMLGKDIATLTGGKLTPSQIPALSINDVFPVASEAELLTLTAERGDCGIIVVNNVVTDSYILAVDDSTQLENWKKLGVSYVANAGHASTADNAVNADKINNKRIVGMTQSQYDNAVLDDNTFYIVTPDEV